MNDETRAALERATRSMLTKAYYMGRSGSPYDTNDESKRLVDVIEDDFAAQHTPVAEDAVERAAEAIHDVDRKKFPDVVRHIPSRTVYLARARAALSAMHADIAARALSDEVVEKAAVAHWGFVHFTEWEVAFEHQKDLARG